MECSVLKVDYRQIDRAIRQYLKTGDERAFVKQFIEGSIPSKMRFDRRTLDSSDEVQKSVKEFADTVELVVANLKGKFPGSATALDNLLSNLDNLLFIPTDNNQKGTGSSEEQDEAEEDKSLTESFDRNRAKLDEHLKEFYGLGSYNIINNLKDQFEDAITSVAYWDRNSGDIIVNNNSILNRNIQKYKNILYKRLVTFLKQEGILKNDALESMVDEEGKFIGREYFHTLEKFYSYFSNLENAQDLLVTDNKNRINNALKKEKQERYTVLVQTLLNIPDEKLRERIRTRIINAHGRRIGNDFENTSLYTADSYSEYFKTLNSMIKDKSFNLQDVKVNLGNGNTQTVSQILEFFDSEDSTLLNAANAYTILTHFDKLIKERQTSISIDKDLEDIEIADPNKYSYHQDTSHEKKGWQTSEDVSSEKYTSTLTKALFKQIKIYDYNTDQYTNKRVDSTSFIVSTRNLIDDIVYGRIGFSGDDVKDSFVQKSANELKECVVNLHSNPTKNFQRILELLFDNGNYDLIDRIKPIEGKKLLTTNDINIMYSIYNAVFNKNNMNSLIKAELSQASSINARALSLVGEIAGYVDRNASMHYMETSIDYENGNVIIKVKRKFSNNIGLKKTIDTINNLANHRTDQSMKSLRDKYKFIYPTSSLGRLVYSVKIGDNNFKISVADMGSKIFYGKGQAVTTETHTLLKTLDKVDLIDFRNHVISGTILSPEEQQLKELLDYFEDTLGIKFKTDSEFNLQILQIFKENYNPANIERGVKGNHSPSENYSGYLEPLLMLAMRANYVNERRAEAADAKKTLMDYITSLGSKDDGIYGNYSRNKNTNHVFSERWEDLQYQVVSRQDDVLSMWEDSKAMLTGVASRATTKDRGGNNIPNNGVNKLGNILHHEIAKQLNNPNSNVTSLLFVQQDGLIKGTLHDLEVTSQDGDYKSLRDFSSGELFYHSIFNKFWGNYIGQGSVIIQPTTYSDKTTFLNWNISTKFMGGKDILSAEYDEPYKYRSAIVGMYGDTIGKMYRDVWTSTKNKLQIIADAYNTNNDTRLSFKEVLNLLSEEQLISYASTLGLTLEKDKDYRKRSKNSCTYNELLEYYSDYLYAPNAKGQYANLESYLDQQKSIFVQNLLQANSSFQVIDYNDNINNYIKDKADYSNVRNSVINSIIEYFKKDKTNGVEKRKKFFNTWVDKNTGKLILAKTSNGIPILGIGEAYNGEPVTLNPFLDKFFYVEGLLSNNLRMSLTGSEINHPDKAKKSTYNLAKKLDLKDAKNIDILRKALGLNRLTVTEALNLQSFLKKNTITIHDLASQATLDKAKTAGIGILVDRVYHRTITDIANTAQGTQFKRNVIIPATLQYCRQKAIDGIPSKIKCAVIMDEKAPVYNYRGDKEESIDAADGSAQITPFQSIMENRSLDSQAVGFIKKPIWHAYDAESGTAFLAKFATDTITNESMRASLKANSSLFRMFKKMTNLQWQGDVDLTQGITIGRKSTPATMRTWFQTRILGNAVENNVLIGNNRLIYQDGYGDNIEILSLLADKTDLPIYYTEEIDVLLKNTPNVKPQKVYHVFYNQETNKSIHVKFDSAEKARAFIRSTPGAHTINSLYELHTALGGINCVDSQGNYSEFNNEVVVNYMTEIGSIREGHTSSEQKDQDSYFQPMKQYHIGYALNNSAVKNGAKNINKSSAWSDDSELNYFEVDSEGLGMQMNADHDIIDSELTEFSQVITATSAYGYTYDNSNEIFISLGMAAFQASDKALRAVEDFINISFDDDESKQQALSDLYDAVGRIIMTNRSIKDQESLQNVIMEAVQKIFYNSKNHLTDDAKIPFSDANVYADFIATLASTINKESIKRKHPGSGCVMVPGYNMVQYFEIDGQKLMTEDILKLARQDYKEELIKGLQLPEYNWDPKFNKIIVQGKKEPETKYLSNMSIKALQQLYMDLGIQITSSYLLDSQDNTNININFIDKYLAKKQAEASIYNDDTWFMPSDIVNILDEYGQVLRTIDLDSLPKYYKFKQGLDALELATGVKIDVDYESGIATVNGKEYTISDSLCNEIMVDLGITELPMYKYQVNITKPHNLRPSLIRWQYKGEDGNVYYRNIFDTDVIRNAYINRNSLGEDYRTKIQDILHKLYEGKDDQNKQIVEGSLENTAAELVMSNIYQDKFEIGGESLYDVLNQGEEYFRQKTGKQLRIPSNRLYDIAFLSDTGNSTLISLRHIKASEDENRSVYENDFNEQELMTNEKDEIVLMKGNRELFEVGRWTSAKDVIYRDGKFYRGTVELNPKDYRLKDANDITSVQRKIMYVRRFNTIDTIERKGRSRIEKNTLYEIADIKFFIEAMKDLPQRQGQTPIMSATNQRASIIDKMFGNHKAIYINGNKDWRKRGDSSPLQPVMAALSRIIGTRKDNGDGTFQYIGGNKYISDDIKNLTYTQLDYLQEDLEEYIKPEKGKEKEDAKYKAERRKQNFAKWMKAQETFLQQEAHRKWVSFQDSTNFIASRIPAQTLQSFMSMKLVAWTQNSKNMAYVSHFQTYLQGSDYDIDKAYIMGQSYNNSANYIGWSTLFDYTSYATLQASKQLPVPKGEQWAKAARHLKGDKEAYAKATQVWQDTSETDTDIEEFLQLTNGKIKDLQLERDRVRALTLLSRIIKKTEANNRGIKYNGTNTEGLNNLMQLINDHEFTPLHPSIAEAAYKNVASANIYAVAHDIRNRDQAYTAISMGILQKAAADSPKGNQAGSLNMLNPLTKYIMQYQNLVGKNVIAIAANGEKVWFNAYYYWTKILQSGNEEDIQRLKFKQTFKRIAGRAKGTPYEKSVSTLPDMNFRDARIRNALLSQFNVSEKDLEYVYVDQLISQLLSAATDNAKELILAKINSGTNFARMYVYAIMTGYDINDIVAFMTSPVAEFVDQMSAANIFTKDSASNNPNSAISLAEGFINSDLFLHGTVTNTGTDEMGLEVKENVSKQSLVAVSFNNLSQEIKEAVKVEAELTESKVPFNQKTLNIAMKGLINVAIKLDKFNLKEALRIRNNDMEINTYLAYCQNIIDKLRSVYKQYSEGFDAAKADIVEFKKLYELATEVSTISTAYLSLNQGLPTDELGILKKIAAMEKIVTNRERIIGIRRNNMYTNAKATIIEEDGEVQETKKGKERSPEKLYEEKRKVAMKIIENNPTLGNDEASIANIIAKLDNAYADDIMNNFDAVKYLLDNNYRQKVKDYYGLIMGTLNVFDMMEKIPTYQTNLECLKLLVVSNNLSVKSRLVNTLLRSNNNVSDQELRNVIRYADQLLTYKFAKEELFNKGKGIITLPNEIIGFDEYFKDTTVTQIDLGSLNGLATFRRWIENEFYDWVREHPVYGKNGAIKHLQRIQDGDQTILAMDIDLLEPNTNSQSELAYDEILRGMVELDDTKSAYNSQYTIADLLQLYNIIVNNNQYGSERLTTAFKVCTNPNNILNTYLRYISETDLNPQDIYNDISLDYDNIDYKMTSAPLISKYAERNHKELYIKVKDDLRGYILKKYDSKNNKYNEDPLTKAILPTIKQLYNFSVYSPFLFLNSHDRNRKDNIMVFENILDKSLPELSAKELFKLKQDLYNLLQQSSISNRLRIFKNCY